MHIIYKPHTDLTSQTAYPTTAMKETKNQEIEGMGVSMNTISMSINIPVCISIQDIQTATCEVGHTERRNSSKHKAILATTNELTMIVGIVMKGKRIQILSPLQKQIL